MLFLVESHVSPPESLNREEWAALAEAETAYGIEARRAGKLVDIWRVVGQYAAFAIWDANDNDELHELISGLPMYAYATFNVTALATHPSTRRWRELQG